MQAEALPSNDSAARDMNIVITAYTIAQVSLGTLSGHTLYLLPACRRRRGFRWCRSAFTTLCLAQARARSP